jgi:hypothetical protein
MHAHVTLLRRMGGSEALPRETPARHRTTHACHPGRGSSNTARKGGTAGDGDLLYKGTRYKTVRIRLGLDLHQRSMAE